MYTSHPPPTANTQVIGSVLLAAVFGFFAMILDRGASKTAVLIGFGVVFQHLGITLLQKRQSEMIGGFLYTVPSFAAPAVAVGVLFELNMLNYPELKACVKSLMDASDGKHAAIDHGCVCVCVYAHACVSVLI